MELWWYSPLEAAAELLAAAAAAETADMVIEAIPMGEVAP